MFYTLIPSPNPYVVVVVSHLLATKITYGPWMKSFGAEMKNPVIPVDSRPSSVGEHSVRPILEYRFDTKCVYTLQG